MIQKAILSRLRRLVEWLCPWRRELRQIIEQQRKIIKQQEALLMDEAEALQILSDTKNAVDGVKTTLVKAQGEIVTKIAELEGMLGAVTPAVASKIGELRQAVQDLSPVATSLDEIVPDQP